MEIKQIHNRTHECHVSNATLWEVVIVWVVAGRRTRKHNVVAARMIWIRLCRHAIWTTVVLHSNKPHSTRILVWLNYFNLTLCTYNPEGVSNIEKKIQNWVRSSVCAVCSQQTVEQKDSIEALHQNWNPLVQEAGLSSLTQVFRDPPSKIIEEVTSWCVKNARGLYRQLAQRFNEHRGWRTSPLCEWLPSLLLHLPQEPLCQCMTQPVDTWQSRNDLPLCQGTSMTLSGLFLSVQNSPIGSLVMRTTAEAVGV